MTRIIDKQHRKVPITLEGIMQDPKADASMKQLYIRKQMLADAQNFGTNLGLSHKQQVESNLDLLIKQELNDGREVKKDSVYHYWGGNKYRGDAHTDVKAMQNFARKKNDVTEWQSAMFNGGVYK